MDYTQFSTFCGYLYNDSYTKNNGRDGYPISHFMDNSDLAYDFAKIDHSTNELVIKYGVTEIERVPMDKVAKKYYRLAK